MDKVKTILIVCGHSLLPHFVSARVETAYGHSVIIIGDDYRVPVDCKELESLAARIKLEAGIKELEALTDEVLASLIKEQTLSQWDELVMIGDVSHGNVFPNFTNSLYKRPFLKRSYTRRARDNPG